MPDHDCSALPPPSRQRYQVDAREEGRSLRWNMHKVPNYSLWEEIDTHWVASKAYPTLPTRGREPIFSAGLII